jgi:hypothetical protein
MILAVFVIYALSTTSDYRDASPGTV